MECFKKFQLQVQAELEKYVTDSKFSECCCKVQTSHIFGASPIPAKLWEYNNSIFIIVNNNQDFLNN